MVEFRQLLRVTLLGSRNDRSAKSFEPARDIPRLDGKVVLITGAAGDLGRETAVELARHGRPARIYVADLPRDDDAKRKLVDRITYEAFGELKSEGSETVPATEIRFLELDLSSFESVRKCAADFVAKEQRLDILVLNAGIIRVKTGITSEGYEVHFGINYLGHALLSRLLVPTMLRTLQEPSCTGVRLVVVSSEGYAMAPKGGIQFDRLKTACAKMSYTQRYGQSKLALIGLTRQLGRDCPEIETVAVHPGRVVTGMGVSLAGESFLVRITGPLAPLICVPLSVGVRNHLWAATSRDVVSGTYYEPVGVPKRDKAMAKKESLWKRLYEWTEDELKDVVALE